MCSAYKFEADELKKRELGAKFAEQCQKQVIRTLTYALDQAKKLFKSKRKSIVNLIL